MATRFEEHNQATERKIRSLHTLVGEFRKDLKQRTSSRDAFITDIEKLQTERAKSKGAILTFQEFHELFQNVANITTKIENMLDLDFIMRKIFMNFIVERGKVIKIQQTPIFEQLSQKQKNQPNADSSVVTLWRIELQLTP